jgi:hypothetical protein
MLKDNLRKQSYDYAVSIVGEKIIAYLQLVTEAGKKFHESQLLDSDPEHAVTGAKLGAAAGVAYNEMAVSLREAMVLPCVLSNAIQYGLENQLHHKTPYRSDFSRLTPSSIRV